MKNRFLILMICLCIAGANNRAYSQIPEGPKLPNNIPPSPTAASLGIYGEVPVNNYSGQVNAEIPLYKYSQSGFELDMKLSYLSSGLRYLDKASIVGLGWSLNAGGVITRSIKSVDDLRPNGFSNGTSKDAEPDIFFYNFNGRTGRFILPYSAGLQSAKIINQSEDILIYRENDDNFAALTPDGVKYYFRQKEYSSLTSPSNITNDVISAWYLSEIVLNNNERIVFTYSVAPRSLLSSSSQLMQISISSIGTTATTPECNTQIINSYPRYQSLGGNTIAKADEVLLQRITGKNGQIAFSYDEREDLQTSDGKAKKLISFLIKNNENEVLRNFNFDYSYFSVDGNTASRRLKLTKVEESASDILQKKTHTLGYYEGNIPMTTAATQKYYGYYSQDPFVTMLKSITYPTGGYTQFTYENHDYLPSVSVSTASVPASELGVRIKNMINYDINGNILLNRTFNYNKLINGELLSSGRLLSYYTNLGSNRATYSTSCGNQPVSVTIDRSYVYSSSIVSLGSSSVIVGYDQVNVVDTGINMSNGKKEYFFVNNPDTYDKIIPGVQGTNDYKNGTMIAEKTYAWNPSAKRYTLRQAVYYDYEYVDQSNYSGAVFAYENTSFSVYRIGIFKSRLNNKTESFKEDNVDTIGVSTAYKYTGNYLSPASISSKRSTGDITRLEKKYPFDFSSVFPCNEMLSNHFISPVLEESYSVNSQESIRIKNNYIRKKENNTQLFVLESVASKYDNNTLEQRIESTNFTSNGRPQQIRLSNGPSKAYQWNKNNEYPVVEIINANNNDTKYNYDIRSQNLNFETIAGRSRTLSFTTNYDGNIEIKLFPGTFLSSNSILYVDYMLSGAYSTNGYFCMSNSPSQYCYSGNKDANTLLIKNAPAGNYTLTIYCKTSIPNSAGMVSVTYPQGTLIENALKEFYYQGFEEEEQYRHVNAIFGKGCLYGDYLIPFTAPNAKAYIVDYRYLENGKWFYMKRSFQNNMLLTDGEGIDEVRVYPAGSQMNTYTYTSQVGMTSKTDPKGLTEFYEYDGFQRLRYVKDLDNNIIRTIDYRYKGQ
ncbi:hypothetical protein ACFU8T_20575 [Sphingobacterium spiritivorum]|uniref:hypothetical protein n=1 Tax=Sphingobacterium spiritivorum TaxID=258 RepID=UPI0036C23C55